MKACFRASLDQMDKHADQAKVGLPKYAVVPVSGLPKKLTTLIMKVSMGPIALNDQFFPQPHPGHSPYSRDLAVCTCIEFER